MSYETLLTSLQDGVARVTLNRPEARNALSRTLVQELEAALAAYEADPDARVIVLSGAGDRAFCAGADLKGTSDRGTTLQARESFGGLSRILEAIARMRTPIIAQVHGFALAGGCGLAVGCDLIVASDDAQFGLPEIKIGAFPGGGGTQRLPRLIGTAKAKEMILIGDPITAEQALAVGLVMKVTPKAKLMQEANTFAAKLASLPRLALQASKMLINRSQEMDLASGLELEARSFGAIAHTHDLAEGTKAFMEKRKPNFTGD